MSEIEKSDPAIGETVTVAGVSYTILDASKNDTGFLWHLVPTVPANENHYWVSADAPDGSVHPYFRTNGLTLERALAVKRKLEQFRDVVGRPYRRVDIREMPED